MGSLRDCHPSSGFCRSVAAKGRLPGQGGFIYTYGVSVPTYTLDTLWGLARVPKTGRRRK